MSGRGETPEEEGEQRATDEATDLAFGQTLYDESGTRVGTVRGIEEGGAFLTTREGVESLGIGHARSGHAFGEAELVWTCADCGEVGEIQGGLPETCPGCDAAREALRYWIED